MKRLVFLFIFLVFLSFPIQAQAHSGGTNSYGCHNCYTSECYGEYHCHNGGSGGNWEGSSSYYSAPQPRPLNPTSGKYDYKVSGENWCNYDLTMSWSGAVNATGYSVVLSKIAGADPGPLPDATSESLVFTNVNPGTWYINMKALSSTWGTSASNVTYWTITLPQLAPTFDVSMRNDIIDYDFTCLSKVEVPDFLISDMKLSSNRPVGMVRIPNNGEQSLIFRGWDSEGKIYEKTLMFSSTSAIPKTSPKINDFSDPGVDDNSWALIVIMMSGILVIGPIIVLKRVSELKS